VTEKSGVEIKTHPDLVQQEPSHPDCRLQAAITPILKAGDLREIHLRFDEPLNSAKLIHFIL
jgi:hypothetical protein